MTLLVIDCSVTMAWCFEDESATAAEAALDRLETADAVVPGLWPLEVANVLAVAERSSRLTPSETSAFLALLAELPIRIDEETTPRAFGDVLSLARRRGISAYDAAYLELALRRRCPLCTLDGPLREAAEAEGVEILTA